jgi:IS30 family transposase
LNPQEQDEYLRNLRREKVQQLLACKVSQSDISKQLNAPLSTVHTDVVYLRQRAREYARNYEQHFSEEYIQIIDFLSAVQLEAWNKARKVKYERNLGQLLLK